MRLHGLKPAPGARKAARRLGRGNASGQGTTAGKGTKGQKARSGGAKPGFRGMSSRNARLPKLRGFNNKFKIVYRPISVSDLSRFPTGSTIGVEQLIEGGFVSARKPHAKILGTGDITIPVHVVGVKVSGTARSKIEGAGGSVTHESRLSQEESHDSSGS